MTSKATLREEITQLRKEINDLQLETSSLRLVTEALWEAQWNPNVEIAISYGDEHPEQGFDYKWFYLGRYKVLAEERHQISQVVSAELKRLEEIFPNRKCPQCGKWLDPIISCCPHCLASKI